MELTITFRPNANGYSENFSVCEFKQRLENHCRDDFPDLDHSKEAFGLYCTLDTKRWDLEVFVMERVKLSRKELKGNYTSRASWFMSEGGEIRRIMLFDKPEEVYDNFKEAVQELFDFHKKYLETQKAKSEEEISRAKKRLDEIESDTRRYEEVLENYNHALNRDKQEL